MRQFCFPSDLPERVREEPQLRAEVKVFDLLKEQVESDPTLNLLIFHDNSWSKLNKSKKGTVKWGNGQSDFIIFSEQYGFINFEIKGGIISYEDGQWYTTPINGRNKKPLKEPPIDQTNRNKWALQQLIYEKINEQEGQEIYNKYNVPWNFRHAVCFPDTPSNTSLYDRAEADKSFVFCKEDLDNLAIKLKLLLESEFINNPPNTFDRPGTPLLSILKKLFSNSINQEYDRTNYMDVVRNRLHEAEKNQEELIETTESQENGVFVGGAGSGKTYLAKKKIGQLIDKDKKSSILFLSSNPNFISQMSFAPEDYFKKSWTGEKNAKLTNFPSPLLSICSPASLIQKVKSTMPPEETYSDSMFEGLSNYHTERAVWYMPVKKESNQKSDWEDKYLEKLTYQVERMHDVLEGDDLSNPKFSHILIDEAQDFSLDYIEIVSLLLRDDTKGLYLFLDNNQNINNPRKDKIQNYYKKKGYPIFNLKKNYRNTQKIFNISSTFYEGTTGRCIGPEGIATEFHKAETPYEIKQHLIKILNKLNKENQKDIAILHGDSVSTGGWSFEHGTGLYLVNEIEKNCKKNNLRSFYPFPNKDQWRMCFDEDYSEEFKQASPEIIIEGKDVSKEKGFYNIQMAPSPEYTKDCKIGNFRVYPADSAYLYKEKGIVYDKIINFKGLEREIVILVDIDESMDIPEDIYVGLSRAKAQLIIISGERAINRLKDLSF